VVCATAASVVEPDRTRIRPYAAPLAAIQPSLSSDAGQCKNAKRALMTSTAAVEPVGRAKQRHHYPAQANLLHEGTQRDGQNLVVDRLGYLG